MEVKTGLWDPQKCPFPLNRGNRYKDYENIFLGPTFVSPEWRCPLNRGVLMERFHCSRDKQNRKSERKIKNPSGSRGERAPLPSPRLSSSPVILLPRSIPRACFSYRSFWLEQTTDCSRSRCTIGSWEMSSYRERASTNCKRQSKVTRVDPILQNVLTNPQISIAHC